MPATCTTPRDRQGPLGSSPPPRPVTITSANRAASGPWAMRFRRVASNAFVATANRNE